MTKSCSSFSANCLIAVSNKVTEKTLISEDEATTNESSMWKMTLFKVPCEDLYRLGVDLDIMQQDVCTCISNYQQQSGYNSHVNTDYIDFTNEENLDLMVQSQPTRTAPIATLDASVVISNGSEKFGSANVISCDIAVLSDWNAFAAFSFQVKVACFRISVSGEAILVPVLSVLVHEVQSAFVSGRQIMDGPFILNEIMHWCSSKKKQALIFKVDFEKAYDSVRWDFLDEALQKFGFGNKWRLWIQSCLRSSKSSILVNGSPTTEFQFFKGLKQGDSLSPFLFILIMELSIYPFNAWWTLILRTPFKYLGTKVGGTMHRAIAWQEVIDKSKKASWVKWGTVTSAKDQGGLGVASLYTLNRALMLKWMWRFFANQDSLWTRVVKAIHGEDGNIGKDLRSGRRSCWQTIVNEARVLKNQGIDFFEFLKLKVGDEVSSNITLAPQADRYNWLLNNDGVYSVASLRKKIDNQRSPGEASRTRWVKYIPIKVNILAWKIKLNALPTRFNLSRRDDKLSDKELKQIEADDQAIQTILLGLPEDIYAAVDSCETAQEIWQRVQQ
nr:RNA-directed DNA polymerase, eukaryota [Tanacetum cinerariifolium]